jgi:hypothetical protein
MKDTITNTDLGLMILPVVTTTLLIERAIVAWARVLRQRLGRAHSFRLPLLASRG